ncbi:MAG: hypothetical protein ACPG5B_13175 [Chitinophagales bacterium]
MNYKIISQDDLRIISTHQNVSFLQKAKILEAIEFTHYIFDKFLDFEVDVFGILGMRNLSAFVGEVFAKALEKKSDGLLIKNPHQDGYPDLLLMDEKGKEYWQKLSDMLKDKAPFSPFVNGGIEIKATCGSVPTPAQCRKKGLEKPDIGDQRIGFLRKYDWKAHHRETNNLIGILWDFIDAVPRIVALFYSSDLTENDWGKIVKPKKGGGRTTSVSIMNRKGIQKMYEGTILVFDNERYINFLNRYNSSDKL